MENKSQCCDITSKLLIYRIIFDFKTWWVCEHGHVFENVNKNRRVVYLLFKCIKVYKICGKYNGVCKLQWEYVNTMFINIFSKENDKILNFFSCVALIFFCDLF